MEKNSLKKSLRLGFFCGSVVRGIIIILCREMRNRVHLKKQKLENVLFQLSVWYREDGKSFSFIIISQLIDLLIPAVSFCRYLADILEMKQPPVSPSS